MKKNFNDFDDLDDPTEKGSLIRLIPIVIGVVAILVLIIVLKNTIFSSKTDKTTTEDTTNASETIDTTVADTVTEDTTDTTTDTTVAPDVPVVAADVADIDDANDPQASVEGNADGSSGATVDLSTSTIATNEFETSGVTYGIDVSKYQGGDINWQKVKDSGVEFAMIRVGYRTAISGEIYEDPCAKYNLQQAAAVGIKIGVYFYSTAITQAEAEEEAAWVTGFIASYPITYPVAYNCEGFSDSANRQYVLSQTDRTNIAKYFLDYIAAQGYTPMFYSSKNELTNNAKWDTDKLSSAYKMWVAQYPDVPYPQTAASSYTGTLAMWQYTSNGQVSGISKSVDIDVAYFNYTQSATAKDTTTPVEVVASNPEVGIVFSEVNETVTAKEKTNLRSVPSSASSDTIVTTLTYGDTGTRTGVGNNGWSRVIYNGQTLYAVSSYLTTDLAYQTTTAATPAPVTGPVATAVNDTVTAKNSTNLRSTPSQASSDNIVAVLNFGDTAVRTSIQSDGWSVVTYNNQTLYAITNYLTTDMNYQATATPTVDNPETIYTYTAVTEQVTPKIEVNLRTVPSTASADTIVVKIAAGEVLQRTGIGSDGWSRISYNGQNLYAVTSYLTVVQ